MSAALVALAVSSIKSTIELVEGMLDTANTSKIALDALLYLFQCSANVDRYETEESEREQ